MKQILGSQKVKIEQILGIYAHVRLVDMLDLPAYSKTVIRFPAFCDVMSLLTNGESNMILLSGQL